MTGGNNKCFVCAPGEWAVALTQLIALPVWMVGSSCLAKEPRGKRQAARSKSKGTETRAMTNESNVRSSRVVVAQAAVVLSAAAGGRHTATATTATTVVAGFNLSCFLPTSSFWPIPTPGGQATSKLPQLEIQLKWKMSPAELLPQNLGQLPSWHKTLATATATATAAGEIAKRKSNYLNASGVRLWAVGDGRWRRRGRANY